MARRNEKEGTGEDFFEDIPKNQNTSYILIKEAPSAVLGSSWPLN